MKFKGNKKITSWLLCMILAVSMALTMIGCGKDDNEETKATTESQSTSEEAKVTVLGEGATKFAFIVVDKDGNETAFEINTDKETVGDALLELNLIEGDEGDYGLYVKKVNGITADYDKDQTYWAFYVNGEYASSGVDTTTIEDGAEYMFKVEK